MNSVIRNIGFGLIAGLALLTVSCTRSDEGEIDASRGNPSETWAQPSGAPKPVASVSLPNGNAVEFYDFGQDVMVSEVGQAGTPPVFTNANWPETFKKGDANRQNTLEEIWKIAAPSQPVPQALLDIQARWIKSTAVQPPATNIPKMSHEASGIPFGQTGNGPSSLPKTAAPSGCNNGCCDYQWLSSTFGECTAIGDYSWFLYNYGYSWANIYDVDWYSGIVCGAAGISQWNLHVSSGAGGSWPVPAGTYRTYRWTAGWFNKDLTSNVNTSTAQALHTQCGVIWH
jgi:hypothetical protein